MIEVWRVASRWGQVFALVSSSIRNTSLSSNTETTAANAKKAVQEPNPVASRLPKSGPRCCTPAHVVCVCG